MHGFLRQIEQETKPSTFFVIFIISVTFNLSGLTVVTLLEKNALKSFS